MKRLEADLAAFYGAETATVVSCGFSGNLAIWTALPRPGDVVLYDSGIHASVRKGLSSSLAGKTVEFAHNDIDAFRPALRRVWSNKALIRQGRRSILVSVLSVYSMTGTVCPLEELIEVANEVSGSLGNIQFIMDEAHSTGIIGPNGAGLVAELGLQDEVAVRLCTFGKALDAAVVSFLHPQRSV
jgi:8-amino-7-oxononanoate synthase